MAFEWTDKIDGVDDVLAKDINDIAHAVTELEKKCDNVKDGTTFFPSVSDDGVLSWENDGGRENPAPVNLKSEIVQTSGNSKTKVMSQKAVTDYVPKIKTRNQMPTNFENASINTTTGIFASSTSIKYAASPDFIEVVGGETYTFSCERSTWLAYGRLYVHQYTADEEYIKNVYVENLRQESVSVTLEADCAFVRVSLYAPSGSTAWQDLVPDKFQMELGATATEYIPPEVIDPIVIDKDEILKVVLGTDYLYGKKLACVGDSITAATTADGGSFVNYAELVGQRHNMIVYKDGKGGSTMSNVEGHHPFCVDRYLNVPSDFDILTIWFGWNDASYGQLGTIDDTVDTTFYGAYKKVLTYFVTTYPTKKIGLIVPYGNSSVEPFRVAVRELSEMYGIPCLDLVDGKQCSLLWGTANDVQLARRSALTHDGTHPNQAGYEYLSTMYEEFIKRI